MVEPGGGSISPDGVYTAPAVPGTYTVKAVSQFDSSASGTAQVVVVVIREGHIPGYDVGVDYHAYGANFAQTAFLTIYDQPQVRQTVQQQLQGMADRGATFMHTSIWFVTTPGTSNLGETWRNTFPITDQEAANLRAYAQDVAAVKGAGGNRLRLDIALMWIGASDYGIGSPTTGLGYTPIPAAEFISNIEATTDKVLAAVAGVTRPDGVRVVDTIFFDDEVQIAGPGETTNGRPNSGWFLSNNYPRFVSVATQQGIRPSVYFSADGNQTAVFDSTYIDSLYPVLNGRRSMFGIYRSLKYMADNQLPIPSRIDFSCYLTSTGATYNEILQHILDDADATLPSLGAPQLYGAAETHYLSDPNQRYQYGQAFPAQASFNSRLQRVSFWTTGQEGAYPFTIEDFFPPAP